MEATGIEDITQRLVNLRVRNQKLEDSPFKIQIPSTNARPLTNVDFTVVVQEGAGAMRFEIQRGENRPVGNLFLSKDFLNELKAVAKQKGPKPPLCVIGHRTKEGRKTLFSEGFIFSFLSVVFVGQESKNSEYLLESKNNNKKSLLIVELPYDARGVVVAREWQRVFCLLLAGFVENSRKYNVGASSNYFSSYFVLDDDCKKICTKYFPSNTVETVEFESFAIECRKYLLKHEAIKFISVSPARNIKYFAKHMKEKASVPNLGEHWFLRETKSPEQAYVVSHSCWELQHYAPVSWLLLSDGGWKKLKANVPKQTIRFEHYGKAGERNLRDLVFLHCDDFGFGKDAQKGILIKNVYFKELSEDRRNTSAAGT